jgi:hypothetical protein
LYKFQYFSNPCTIFNGLNKFLQEEGLREEGDGVTVRVGCSYIPRKHDENHWIDDRWLQNVGLFGPTWASLCIVFPFCFLLHHCEVTQKNNYVICTNIFFIYNSMNTSFYLGVSRIFEWICYFLSFKWISTCLPKVIQNWPICTSNKL